MLDLTWITPRIAVGGGIWNDARMAELVRLDVSHIICMQIEFDDRPLAAPYPVQVLWNPVEDDFQPKPPAVFAKGVEFARQALAAPEGRIFIHCTAGVHRAPMMTLAVLTAVEGWPLEQAMAALRRERPVVDLADVYVQSVRDYLRIAAARP